MKKFLQLIMVLCFFSFSSCGPSAEEKAKMEQEAGEAVDSMMNALESEMETGTESTSEEPAQEEQTTTKESEEAPK